MPTYTNKLEISKAITAAKTESGLQSVYAFNAVFIDKDTALDQQYRSRMIAIKLTKKPRTAIK